MIADSATGSGFGSAVGYITSKADEGQDGWARWAREQLGIGEEVDAIQTRNILLDDDPQEAAEEMRVTANQNERVEKPRYSLSISYHPEDDPTDREMVADMDEILDRRGLGEHQAVYAVHRDQDHAHIHAAVNRVHPETGDLWRDSFDYYENMDVLREIEQRKGWTRPRRDDSRGRIADWKIRRFERTGEIPFSQEVKAQLGDSFAEAKTWRRLQTDLAEEGLQIQKKGSGAVVTDGEEEAPLSEIARAWSFNKLDSRFSDQFQTYERTQGPDRQGGSEAKRAEGGTGGDQEGSRGAEERSQRSGRGAEADQTEDGRGRGGRPEGTGAESGAERDADDAQRGSQDVEESRKDLRREESGALENREDGGRGPRHDQESQESREESTTEGDGSESPVPDYSDIDPLAWRDAEILGDAPNELEEVEPVEGEGLITVPQRLSERGREAWRLLSRERDVEAAEAFLSMDEGSQKEDWGEMSDFDRKRLREAIEAFREQKEGSDRTSDRSQSQGESQSQDRSNDSGRSRGRRGGEGQSRGGISR